MFLNYMYHIYVSLVMRQRLWIHFVVKKVNGEGHRSLLKQNVFHNDNFDEFSVN